jgi:hypothetical protein
VVAKPRSRSRVRFEIPSRKGHWAIGDVRHMFVCRDGERPPARRDRNQNEHLSRMTCGRFGHFSLAMDLF